MIAIFIGLSFWNFLITLWSKGENLSVVVVLLFDVPVLLRHSSK
jgi:hypothetical protein